MKSFDNLKSHKKKYIKYLNDSSIGWFHPPEIRERNNYFWITRRQLGWVQLYDPFNR